MFNPGVSILIGMMTNDYNSYVGLAKKLGYHGDTISGWVDHGGISLTALNNLATLFNVPLSEFIRWGEENSDIESLKEEVLKWRK